MNKETENETGAREAAEGARELGKVISIDEGLIKDHLAGWS